MSSKILDRRACQRRRLEEIDKVQGFVLGTWSHGLRIKKLYINVAVPLALETVPSQWSLAPSVTPVTSVG